MAEEKVYANGLFAKTQKTSFGDLTKLSFRADEFKKFLEDNRDEKGWVNVDLFNKKDGSGYYGVLNNFVPKEGNKEKAIVVEDDSNDLPF